MRIPVRQISLTQKLVPLLAKIKTKEPDGESRGLIASFFSFADCSMIVLFRLTVMVRPERNDDELSTALTFRPFLLSVPYSDGYFG